MERREWLIRGLIGFGVVCLLVILVQFFWPNSRALPFSRVNGDNVGLIDKAALTSKLASISKQQLSLTVGKETFKGEIGAAGVSADASATLDKLSVYPWYWRVVPFSSLVIGALRDEPVQIKVNQKAAEKYAKKLKDVCSVPPHNATLKVVGETVELDPAKDGTACPTESIVRQLDRQVIDDKGLSYTLRLTVVPPKRTDKDVTKLLAQAKAVVAKSLVVAVAGKNYAVPKEAVASWLLFVEQKDNTLQLDASADQMKKYFETIQKDIYIKPGITTITTRDGVEVSRRVGAPGRGIDGDKSAEVLKRAVLEQAGSAELTVAALPPNEQYSRSYSNTPEGLQAMVNDLSAANRGMSISVRKLGDSGVHAKGDEQAHPASTYKLFVAYSVLKRIDNGSWTWDKSASGGSVSSCFDRMIVNSDNPCAEWFGSTIGWNTVFGEVRAHGLSRTSVTAGGFVTTTNDLALFLQKLESGQLGLSEPSRARLIDTMKRQVYRSGIPAGASGAVADKVGFLDDILNDAAIVYSPKGVYIITIMSKGSSWGAIANVTKTIDAKLNE